MKRAVRIGVVLSLGVAGVAGCVPAAVPLEIDAGAVAVDDATLTVVVYADDGAGCDAQRFVAAPNLPVLLSATAPFASLDIPRAGEKLVVVNAVVDERSVARGCIEVGSEVDNAVQRVVLAPTLHLTNVDTTTLVLADPAVGAAVTVVDATGSTVADAAVRVRVLDSQGALVGESTVLTSDETGQVQIAPTSAPAGPVRVELVVEHPRDAQPTRLAGFAPPAVNTIVADVTLRPFATTTGAVFAGVDASGVVVVDVAGGVAGPARTVLPSPTARLAGVIDGVTRQWVVVDAGAPALVSDVDGALVSAGAALVDDSAPLRFIPTGDCAAPALPGIVSSASEQVLLTLVDGVLIATPLPPDRRPVSSACAVDDAGNVHRLLVLAGAPVGVVDVGAGLVSAEALTGAAVVGGLERSVGVLVRHDGALLSVERDGAEVLVRVLNLVGSAFVAEVGGLRLPAAPLLVAHGAFGGDDDLAVLTGALFGQSAVADGPIAAGFATTLCSAVACSDGTAADLDNDGPLELLLPQPTGGAIVRFR